MHLSPDLTVYHPSQLRMELGRALEGLAGTPTQTYCPRMRFEHPASRAAFALVGTHTRTVLRCAYILDAYQCSMCEVDRK